MTLEMETHVMDNGRWTMNCFSLWVSLYFLYVSVSLQIATLAQSMLSPVAAADTSQTTPVQITHACVLCCFTHIEHVQF